MACPNCGSTNVKPSDFGGGWWECQEEDCGADWNPNRKKK